MAVAEKKISYRMYLVVFIMFMMAVLVMIKLNNIQWVEGDSLRKLAKERTVKNFTIPANRGNVYSSDGSLLATSIPEYIIRFDALSPSNEDFNENISALSDSLSSYFGKSSGYYESKLKKARANKNRYFLVARELSYSDYLRLRVFLCLKRDHTKAELL